jgi:hypothetical protein
MTSKPLSPIRVQINIDRANLGDGATTADLHRYMAALDAELRKSLGVVEFDTHVADSMIRGYVDLEDRYDDEGESKQIKAERTFFRILECVDETNW